MSCVTVEGRSHLSLALLNSHRSCWFQAWHDRCWCKPDFFWGSSLEAASDPDEDADRGYGVVPKRQGDALGRGRLGLAVGEGLGREGGGRWRTAKSDGRRGGLVSVRKRSGQK